MSNSHKAFIQSDEAVAMREELLRMVSDPLYNTDSRTQSAEEYVEKHLYYVSRFPYINVTQYVKNLKIKSQLKA